MTNKFAIILDSVSGETRELLLMHVYGGTSAERLSLLCTEYGYPVGATTIKRYRRKVVK